MTKRDSFHWSKKISPPREDKRPWRNGRVVQGRQVHVHFAIDILNQWENIKSLALKLNKKTDTKTNITALHCSLAPMGSSILLHSFTAIRD